MGASASTDIRRRSLPARWLFSSIGKKTVVAVTGIALVLFVIGHLLGNLTFFVGPHAMNAYAMHLRDLGPLLWIVRAGLLAVVTLHIFFTMLVWKENHSARPSKYLREAHVRSTVFARTMRLTGLIVLAFVVFHLAHFTWQIVDHDYSHYETTLDGRSVHDVYRMMVAGFSVPWFSAFYILSLALLAMHLSHGIGSLFQTLGLSNQELRPRFEFAGRALAWTLFLGFTSIPTAVLLGMGANALK
ncbi:MAG: succinate dehydrogenase cytochrome b subunit [Chthoniobacterales bacterium]